MATVRSLDVAVRANTQNFEGGMKKVSVALRSAVAGLNFVTAAAASQEKSFLAMANAVAIGFASGGPVGLAIAGLGVALGSIIGKIKEADAAWADAVKSMSAETDKLAKEWSSLQDKIFVATGGDLAQRRVEDIERQVTALKDALKLAEEAAASAPKRIISAGPNAPPWLRQLMRGDEQKWADFLKSQLWEAEEQLFLARSIAGGERKLGGIEQAKKAAEEIEKAMQRIPMAVQVAADSVFALLDGVFVRGMKAAAALRAVVQNIASIGLRTAVNAAFGISTP